MTKPSQDLNKLRDAFKKIINDIEVAEHEGNIEEVAEELEDEYRRDFATGGTRRSKLGQKLSLPSQHEVVSYDCNGKVLSRFMEDQWKFFERHVYYTHNFRHQSEILGLNLMGEMSDHLVRFSKVCAWFMLPGNNPGSGVRSHTSTRINMRYFRYLITLLMDKGFLLNVAMTAPKPLRLLNVAELKAELRNRMEHNRPSSHVAGLFRAIARWVQMADYVELPAEFMPSFTIGDWQGDKTLLKQVIQYEAKRVTPWREIPHDDLIRLLQESQVYIQDFRDDILFMHRKLKVELVNMLGGKKNQGAFSTGRTQQVFEDLMEHTFANDPRSGVPWFSLQVRKLKRRDSLREVIGASECVPEVSKLIECCIFQMLLWTAVRVEELLHFRVEGLFINGKRLQPDDDAVEIFKLSKGPKGELKPVFELEFLTFKTSKAKSGKLRKIPMAEDATLAFCIIVELFRVTRDRTDNPYLLPAGGTKYVVQEDKGKAPANRNIIKTRLAGLCEKVGVEIHHPHRCRKTLATIIINKNPNSLELIQRLLGHHKPTMTLQYLMKIPGIAEPIRQHITASNRKRILDLVTATSTRRMSGKAGERLMGAIPPQKLAAEILHDTILEYTDMLLADPDFVIIKAPAAWCLRFRTLRPQQLPCLPNIRLINVPPEDLAPEPSNCRPWECGYAAHTGRHLNRARANRDSSRQIASKSNLRATLVQSFTVQAEYWEKVVCHLEHGNEHFQEVINPLVFNVEV